MEGYISPNVPSSLTKRIWKAPTLLRRMWASLYLSQKTYSLISLIHTQCLLMRSSQRLEADWWVTGGWIWVSVHPIPVWAFGTTDSRW